MSPTQTYRASRCNFIYVCLVAADGTFSVGPAGFTVAKTGTGTYVITHGIGKPGYIAVPVVIAAQDYKSSAVLAASDDTTVTIQTYTSTSIVDLAFGVLIFQIQ